ncbi:hypothetical protein BC332_22875 [Capsicum chinense]|nr:hypothetical protein BC332_22875 [Capsicum chinense]
MSIDIPDATNNLNTKMEDNELDDTNNEVNGNDSEDASTGYEMTIQHDELSKKKKRKIIAKLCGTRSHYAYQHVEKKNAKQKESKTKKGKEYRNLIKRALRARLVYGNPNVNRAVSFEYKNCQLAWSEFSESLHLLLPLLNSSSVKNFLRPFSEEKSSDSSVDDTLCPICERKPTNPILAIPSQHSSLGKRSMTEEQIKKKNPGVMKISPWMLARLNSEDVLKAAAENSPACSSKELHRFHCKLKSVLFSYGIS